MKYSVFCERCEAMVDVDDASPLYLYNKSSKFFALCEYCGGLIRYDSHP